MITVYGTPPTRALRVIWLLEEMGLDYAIRPVDFARRSEDAEFLEVSPAAALPGIRDGKVPDDGVRGHLGEGSDEDSEISGSGSAELLDDGTLEIELSFHLGDDGTLRAERDPSSTAC